MVVSLNVTARSWFFCATWYGGTTVDGDYYRNELPMELLPTTRSVADEVHILQQDSGTGSSCTSNVVRLRNGRPTARTLSWVITAFGE